MEYKGLNERDVNERIEKGQINVFENPDDLTLKKILKNNICTFFNLIIFILFRINRLKSFGMRL